MNLAETIYSSRYFLYVMKSEYLKTYNVKHNLDLKEMLKVSKELVSYALNNHCNSSAQVCYFGLKSAIANGLIRKYCRQKGLKEVSNIVIPINSTQHFRWDGLHIYIPCLKAELSFLHVFNPEVIKPLYIELDEEYAHIVCEVEHIDEYEPETRLGVDRNTTSHCVVASIPETGKTFKLGKSCQHIHTKYSKLRRHAQKEGAKKNRHKYRKVKKLKHRESNIIKDINHKTSKEIVEIAKANKSIIVLEDLTDIRKTTKSRKSFRYSLNSWSFYQMESFIGYKAHLQGVPVAFVEPAYTSQECSRCGNIGHRDGKQFQCGCGHRDHADVNAGFNIAHRFCIDRDMRKGSTDTPNGAMS